MELRRNPRVTVTWRGFLKMNDGHLIPVRAQNVSESGLMILCPQALPVNHHYQMMLEIPCIDHSDSPPYKVPCRVSVLHSILSEDNFRIGVEFLELSPLHRDLIAAWVSLTNKYAPPH